MQKTYFVKYGACIPVKGASRSTICDLQRQALSIIPNDLYEIIKELEGNAVEDVIGMYGEENKVALDGYIKFLTQGEYGFLTRNPQMFAQPESGYETPYLIDNALIDSRHGSDHDYKEIFTQLEDLGCRHLMLRYFDNVSIDEVQQTLTYGENSRLKSIFVLMPHDENISDKEYEKLYLSSNRLLNLVLHSANEERLVREGLNISITTQVIDSKHHCGIISQDLFTYNVRTYREGLQFNTCLHKKISVDAEGNICNCPSMPDKAGKFGEVSLHAALAKDEIKKAWEIHKDLIDICKDCEFRRVCTDCRAYTKNDDLYGKPAKCGYDPYTATWQENMSDEAFLEKKSAKIS